MKSATLLVVLERLNAIESMMGKLLVMVTLILILLIYFAFVKED